MRAVGTQQVDSGAWLMCGIAGLFSWAGEAVRPEELLAMTRALAHRGPDGEGVFVSGPVGLGHRRLATLDLSPTGSQPMSFGAGRYWIIHNGEIYNFLELKAQLIGLGHSFLGESDTEVVLAAFVQWGEGCQHRFNGMWAFAIWDSEERRLFLSRDRFGVKPLFYYPARGCLAFASEMKAFLPLSWFPASFDLTAVAGSIMDPTILEATELCAMSGLRRLRAGHCLLARADAEPEVRRWWRTEEHLEAVPEKFGAQVDGFRDRLSSAVLLRMRSDIPVASTLSGGLDSSSILALAANGARSGQGGMERRARVPTAFVASYPGTRQEERAHALEVARHLGISTVVVEVDGPKLIEMLDDFLFQCEEIQRPHPGPWLLYREMARAGIRVSLDGHGGDELLAGYPEHVSVARAKALWPYPHLCRAAELRALRRRMEGDDDGNAWVKDWAASGREYAALAKERWSNRQPVIRRALGRSPELFLRVQPSYELNARAGRSGRESGDPLTARLLDDFHERALPTILRDFDRFSMAHGVEVRSPFLDWRLVCYCFSLPSRAVLGAGQSKRILREAMRGLLPESVRRRTQKVPYKAPLAEWWEGGVREFVLDTSGSSTFLAAEAWDGPAIRQLAEEAAGNDQVSGIQWVLRVVVAHRLMELFNAARVRTLVPEIN